MAPALTLTPAERRTIAALRLRAQLLVGAGAPTPAAAVRALLAMQAQDLGSALWAVGLRSPGSGLAAVERAVAEGEIVRSWPMRGTLHFVAPEDLGWILSLTTERLVRGAASRRAALGLDEPLLEAAREAAIAALSGGLALSRDELVTLFEGVGVAAGGQRGYHVLWYLSQTGTLCPGPHRGTTQTFVLLDEWVPRPRTLDRDEALGELARRYFVSHGPATVHDLAWWSSLTLAEARRGIAVAGPGLGTLSLGEVEHYLAPELADAASAALPESARDAAPAPSPAPSPVPLTLALPGFDEYLLGYQNRDAVLSPDFAERVVPGKNGIFLPTIVHGGEVVGTWKRTATAKGLRVEAAPFAPLGAAAERGFAAAASRYADFRGLPLLS